jgi:hypothetical protein
VFGDRFSRAWFDGANILCPEGRTHPETCIGKFRANFIKSETFDVQQSDDMTLFQVHQSDTFPLLMIYIPAMPAILSRGNPMLLQQTVIFRDDWSIDFGCVQKRRTLFGQSVSECPILFCYTGCSTRTWASQYRQNKTPFLNDVYLSLLSILPIGSDIFP